MGDTLLQSSQLRLHICRTHHRFAAGHSLELGAINSHPMAFDHTRLLAEPHQPGTGPLQRQAVVSAEIGDGLVVRGKTAKQPHQLHIALAFSLQPARGAHLIEVSIQIQLEQIGRIVRRATRPAQQGMSQAQLSQIQHPHKGLDDPARVICWHKVLQRKREQCCLVPILP